MKWLNLLGLVLQFLAFWLVAPEILGEERLRRWEDAIELATMGIVVLLIYLGLWLALSLAAFGLLINFFGDYINSLAAGGNPLGLAVAVVLAGLILYGPFWLTARVAARVTRAPALALDALLKKLETNPNVRRRLLATGAVFFTLGFVLQFAAALSEALASAPG